MISRQLLRDMGPLDGVRMPAPGFRSGQRLDFPAPAKACYNWGMSTASYLDRFLEPVTEALTPAAARKIVDLRADPELTTHIDQLRRKAKEGTLTPDEDAQYKDFVEALDVISIIQAKARRFLAKHPA